MAANDLKLNKIGFDYSGCMRELMKVADEYMTETEDVLIRLFKHEIDRNGNGSHVMKDDAKQVVRSIVHEVLDNTINIQAGFDENMAKGMALDFYVRVMVVLYGNQAHGNISTKPGENTWKKYVTNYGPSTAKTRYAIPQFDQFDVSQHIVDNVMKQVEAWFRVMLIKIMEFCRDSNFFANYVTVTVR